jgi:hypothetical protein
MCARAIRRDNDVFLIVGHLQGSSDSTAAPIFIIPAAVDRWWRRTPGKNQHWE